MTPQRATFIASLLACLLCALSAPRSSPAGDTPHTAPEGILWVAQDDGLLRLRLADGALLEAIGLPEGVEILALDPTCGTLWALGGSQFHAFSTDGLRLLSAPAPLTPPAPSATLSVSPSDGSLWLTGGGPLFELDPGGAVRRSAPLPSLPPTRRALGIDDILGRVWVAAGSNLLAFDRTTETLTAHELARNETIADLAVDVPGGTLWLALSTPHNAIRRIDAEGNTELEISVPAQGPALERIAPDGQGGVWAASRQWLHRYGRDGELEVELRLFAGQGLGPERLDLERDPADGSLWVGLGRHLLHVGSGGEVLHALELEKPLRDLAAFADSDPPWLEITAPTEGAVLATSRPEILFRYEDPGSGVRVDSLRLLLDGAAPPFACVLQPAQGSCLPEPALGEGPHRLVADIADRAGNRSLPAAVGFRIDTQPPPAPDSDRIEVLLAQGVAEVRGAPGSAEPGTVVILTNSRTGESVSVSAREDGSFEARLAAEPGDELLLEVRDEAGNASGWVRLHTGPPLEVRITSPQSGTRLAFDRARVEGSFAGPANCGIVVNGVAALTRGDRFVADDVPLSAGRNDLTAVLSTLDGRSAQAAIELHSEARAPSLLLDAIPKSGVAPLDVLFAYELREVSEPVRLSVDFDGDGREDLSTDDPRAPLMHRYDAPGLYLVRLTVTDAEGAVHVADRTLAVATPAERDALLGEVWDGMKQALAGGDTERALRHISERSRWIYGPAFEALRSELPGVVQDWSGIVPLTPGSGFAEYLILTTFGERTRTFVILFGRDLDGVWRVSSM